MFAIGNAGGKVKLRIPPLGSASKRGVGKAKSLIECRFAVRGSPRHVVIRLRAIQIAADSDERAQYRLSFDDQK